MFQHDFRRLALARDLLPEPLRCGPSSVCFPESDPPEAAQRRNPPDHAAANED